VLVILALIASAMVLWPAGSSATSQGGGTGSPEDAVRGWVTAMTNRDYATADTYLTDEQSTHMSAFVAAICGDVQSADVGTASIRSDTATVKVTLRMSSGTSGDDKQLTWMAQLTRTNGAWKIDNSPDDYSCW
jgi:hypothetical protein